MNEITNYLNEQEVVRGQKYVREGCRSYMLKKTFAGILPTVRKPVKKEWTLVAWDKQGGVCPRCHQPIERNDMSGDHIQPLAEGGAHNKWNIQCLHKKCNSSKGAHDFVRESKLAQVGKTLHINDSEEDGVGS